MTPTEDDLRALLTRRSDDTPGNADRVEQVRGRINRARRRRQAAASGVLALAIAGVAVGLTVPGHGSNASVVPAAPSTKAPAPSQAPTTGTHAPVVPVRPETTAPVGTVPVGPYGVAALAGDGPVLLDATGGRTASVAPRQQGQTALGLSYDSRFLADGIGQDNASIQVTDMTGHVLLSEYTGAWAVAWSPTTDVLAVVNNVRGPVTVTFYRVASDGGTTLATQTIAGAPDYDQHLVWSPDGSRLAVGNDHGVTVMTAAGTVIGRQTFEAADYPEPASWSGDGSHLVVFVHTDSASIDADGVRVVDLDATGHQVGMLPTSLAYQQWWHPLHGTAVLGTLGRFRDVADGKTVARCDLATASCTTLVGGTATSAFDGVPTATGIAYLAIASSGDVSGPYPQPYRLHLAAADGSGARLASGAPATVTQVVASTDGRTLLLVGSGSSGSPAIYRYAGSSAVRLAAVGTNDEIGYYGQSSEIVSWQQPPAR
jgi:dipeptidyl aminopeptidase/acylaminoacyl peptidase